MATYYIDPTWGGTKSGTFALPYAAYSALPALSAGDFVLQKEATTASENVVAGYSGTSGSPITYGVYNASTGLQITNALGVATISGTASVAHNFSTGGQSFVEVVGFRFTNIKDNTVYGCRLGSNAVGTTDGNAARYCVVENETCAGGFLLFPNLAVAGHTIDRCVSSGNSAYGILQASSGGSPVTGKISITNTTCNYNAQAGFRSAFSASTTLLSGVISDCQFKYNGVTQASLGKGIGIDIVSDSSGLRTIRNDCSRNYTMGIRMACFSNATTANQHTASFNTCNYNGEYGIQVSTGGGWVISNNTCNYNGANRGNFYGRGIELFGSAVGKLAGPGVVCYNECSYNYNYGGTLNNGTEGVGIGLDDYHTYINVYGNVIIGNEGNGISVNQNGAAGASSIYGNVLVDNFCAPSSRAGSWSGYVKSQICTYTTEDNLSIYNNTIVLTAQAAASPCLYGVSESTTASGASTVAQNNIVKGHSVGLKVRTGITRINNCFYGNTKNVESNADTTTLSDGTGAVTVDPGLDSAYRPTHASVIAGGSYLGGLDLYGKEFQSPPPIGGVQTQASRTATSRTATVRRIVAN